MKTLNQYKNAYQTAKTAANKTRIFNRAYLNLSHSDFEEFLRWQIALMNAA
jgi:hypothetical protein